MCQKFFNHCMKSSLYLCKEPLFISCDNDAIQPIDLDSQEITFPVSLTLLELLDGFDPNGNSLKDIHSILEDIIKSPSFYFPDVPLIFERNGLSIFVPDDNQDHKLNWASLILQFHISLLQNVGFSAISSTMRYSQRRSTLSEIEKCSFSKNSIS